MAIREPIELNGLQKASVLLMSLGASASAEVFKHLTEQEIETLTSEMVRTRRVDSEIRDAVIGEFEHAYATRKSRGSVGEEFVARALDQALGEERASQVIEKAVTPLEARPFESLWEADPVQIARLLGGEHPQVVALVLTNLPPEKAANVLSELDDSLQTETALRICTMDEIDTEIIREIEEPLKARLTSTSKQTVQVSAGPQVLVEILNHADKPTEKLILEGLNSQDESVARGVREMAFAFEDVTSLSDRTMQLVLTKIDWGDLGLALKGSPGAVKEFVFNNMSERAAGALKEDIELLGQVQARDFEAAQRRIERVIRCLLASGEAVIEESHSERSPQKEQEIEQLDQS